MENKVILITGGSRGIGQAIATYLAGLGHRIAITGRNPDQLEQARKQLPADTLALMADASDDTAARDTVEAVIAHFGQIDVLINNAGTAGPGGPTWLTPSVDWWEVQETNVKGPLLHIQQVLPDMIDRRAGIIINLGSYAAIRPTPGNSAYAASKAALARLTDSVAAEVAEFGIQVFCVSPGLVKTDMTRGVPVFDDVPEHEWSRPEEVCQLVHSLLSEKYAPLSGRFLHVHDDIDELSNDTARIKRERLYQLRMDSLGNLID